MNKKIFSLLVLILSLMISCVAFAADNGMTQEEQAALDKTLEDYRNMGYKYTNQRYGYSIICPQKPLGVLPASLVFEDEKGVHGDVLIFKTQGTDYAPQIAWIVLVDAFTDKEIPENLYKQSEEEKQQFIDHLMNTQPYEFVRLTQVNGQVGVYAVTAKEIVNAQNPNEVMTTDTQLIKTYFRGQYGGRFCVILMELPEFTQDNMGFYRLGLLTFQEWPASVSKDGKTMTKPYKN